MADGSGLPPRDNQSPRRRWRGMLWALRKERPERRRDGTRALIAESLRLQVGTVREAFQLAYGDRAGQDYWRTWLVDGCAAVDVPSLFGLHLIAERERGERRTLGEIPLVSVDVEVAIGRAFASGAVRHRPDLSVDVEALVRWMLSNPLRRDLVPATLEAVLAGGDRHAPSTPASSVQTPTVDPEKDFGAWVDERIAKGLPPPTLKEAGAWARDKGKSREWSRAQMATLPAHKRLRRGESARQWTGAPSGI